MPARLEEVRRLEAENKAKNTSQQYYVVENGWWRRWQASQEQDDCKQEEDQLQQPANSLLLEKGNLREGVKENQDFVLVSEQTWAKLQSWYPNLGPAIPRAMGKEGIHGQHQRVIVESYSLKGVSKVAGHTAADQELTVVPTVTLREVRKQLVALLGLPGSEASYLLVDGFHGSGRVFHEGEMGLTLKEARITNGQEVHAVQATDGGTPQDATGDDLPPLLDQPAMMTDAPAPLAASAGAGEISSGVAGASGSNGSGGGRKDGITTRSGMQYGGGSGTSTGGAGFSFGNSGGFGSKRGGSTMSFYDDTPHQMNGKPPGLAGLSNLGNTCFMNSSLQCLAHMVPTMRLFLTGAFLADINRTNPLGMKGELAEGFAGLMALLWHGDTSSVAPRRFKERIARFAPQFSGYAQHDSQEFLGFLLDGLHEDLNRVKSKPYIEEKDSKGRPDAEVAAEAWANYRARNDSALVDTFVTLQKSTLDCPQCANKSVKFDPLWTLPLPLPESKQRSLVITLVHVDGAQKPTRYVVDVLNSGTVRDVLHSLARLAGLPVTTSTNGSSSNAPSSGGALPAAAPTGAQQQQEAGQGTAPSSAAGALPADGQLPPVDACMVIAKAGRPMAGSYEDVELYTDLRTRVTEIVPSERHTLNEFLVAFYYSPSVHGPRYTELPVAAADAATAAGAGEPTSITSEQPEDKGAEADMQEPQGEAGPADRMDADGSGVQHAEGGPLANGATTTTDTSTKPNPSEPAPSKTEPPPSMVPVVVHLKKKLGINGRANFMGAPLIMWLHPSQVPSDEQLEQDIQVRPGNMYRKEYEVTGGTRDLLARAARAALAPFRTTAGIEAEMEEAAGGGASSTMQEDSTAPGPEAGQQAAGAASEADTAQPAAQLDNTYASTTSMPDLVPDTPAGEAEESAMAIDGSIVPGLPVSTSATDVAGSIDIPAGTEAAAAQAADVATDADGASAGDTSPEKPAADAARAAGEAAIARAAAAAATSSGGGAQQDAGGAQEYGPPPAVQPFDMFALQQAPPQASDPAGGAPGPAPGVLPFRVLLSNDRGDTSALGKMNSLLFDKGSAGFVWHVALEFQDNSTQTKPARSGFGFSVFTQPQQQQPAVTQVSQGHYDLDLMEQPEDHDSVRSHEARLRKGKQPVTLQACLEAFLQPEQLGEDDTWYCPSCKSHVQADKKLDLWALPEVLVIHLKRFMFTRTHREKLDTPVQFGRDLDMRPYVLQHSTQAQAQPVQGTDPAKAPSDTQPDQLMNGHANNQQQVMNGGGLPHAPAAAAGDASMSEASRPDTPAAASSDQVVPQADASMEGAVADGVADVATNGITDTSANPAEQPQQQPATASSSNTTDQFSYTLCAVVNHFGSLGGGHYTAFARMPGPSGQWYCFDDSHVSPVEESEVCTPAAYLLFYRRTQDVAADPPDLLQRMAAAHQEMVEKQQQQAAANGDGEGMDKDRRPDQDTGRPPLSRGAADGDEGDAYAAAAAAVSTPPNNTTYDEAMPGLTWEDEEEEEGANNAQRGQRSNNHAAGSGPMQAAGSWGAGAMQGNQGRNANAAADSFLWGQPAGAGRAYGSSDHDNDMSDWGMDTNPDSAAARRARFGILPTGSNIGMSTSPTDTWPPPSPQRRDHARMMKRSKGHQREGEGEEGWVAHHAGAGSAGSEEEGDRAGSARAPAWTSIPWQDAAEEAGPSQPHQQGVHQLPVGSSGPSYSPALIHSAVHRLQAQMSAAGHQQLGASRGSSGAGGGAGGAGEGWGTGDLGGSGSPATGAPTAGGSTGGGSGAQTWGAAMAQHAGGASAAQQHGLGQHTGSFDDVDMPGGRATSMAGSLQGAGVVSGDEGGPSGNSWAGGQDGDGEEGGSVHERDLELAEMNEMDPEFYQDPSYSPGAPAAAALPPAVPVTGAAYLGAATAAAGASAPASVSQGRQHHVPVGQAASVSPQAGSGALHQCMPSGAPPATAGGSHSKLGELGQKSDGSDQAGGRGQHHALAPMRALSAQGAYTGSGGGSGSGGAGQAGVSSESGHTQGGKAAAMEE